LSGGFATFLGVSLVVIATPGPDTALTVRNTLAGGRRAGLRTAAGVATGQATWALLSAAGVASLLRASQEAFTALRLAGAGYLVFLGGRALLAALRGSGDPAAAHGRLAGWLTGAYRQGLMSNLANPKMVLFFLSLLPQFSGARAGFATPLLLGLVFSALTATWLSGYAVVVAKAGDVLRRRRIRRLVDAAGGAALVLLGVRLARERP
jgi:threonine/homoserine/homoserine lactone efflux protein